MSSSNLSNLIEPKTLELGVNSKFSKQFSYLLFRKIFGDFVLINNFSTLELLPFDPLDALTLDIASTDEHTLESSEAEIVVTLG